MTDDGKRGDPLESVAATEQRLGLVSEQARRYANRTKLVGMLVGVAVAVVIIGAALRGRPRPPVMVLGIALVTLGLGVAAGVATYFAVRRFGGEWTQPALLLGVGHSRRRRVHWSLMLGRPIRSEDMELVLDLRTKLRGGRWVLLLSMGWLCVLNPVLMSNRDAVPSVFRWSFLFVPFGIYFIAQSFWLYRQAGRALAAPAVRTGA